MNKIETLEDKLRLQLKNVQAMIYIVEDPIKFQDNFNRLRELSEQYKQLTGKYFNVEVKYDTNSRTDN